MKNSVKYILTSITMTLVLAACAPEAKKENTISANEKMSSKDLADSGEQLLMPHSLPLAAKAFKMALAKDPENKKAQFYDLFLKRILLLEGSVERLKPYVTANGDTERFNAELDSYPNGSLTKKFLLTKKEDAKPLNTAQDIQRLLIDYRLAAEEFHKFLATNPELNLDLHVNPMVFVDDRADDCQVTPESTDSDLTIVCSEKPPVVKMNSADIVAIKQAVAGEIAYLSVYTSYSVGSDNSIYAPDAMRGLSNKEIVEKITSSKDVGSLMKEQGLTALKKLGADLAVGVKWAIKFQDRLCSKDGKRMVRKGFVMQDICTNNETQNSLAVLEQVLAGPMVLSNTGDARVKPEQKVNLLAFFDRPATNLRAYLPSAWDNLGQYTLDFKDRTLNGMLPEADANDVAKRLTEEE